ncbi:papain family cysteine protease (macronuclear) [Tetrahymena thermophila SB210]|uniref:Papain family cysteine protease n=1 Tax=Tetrahymena thermophila (strain SB210) TaxID=312017 RepID=Q23F17_TETTS|nr:papain family cysteine protease [Tetrahymena thermophila SB210]EAR95088.1 papain family cysteine protease [Tetrahymena thermophila SB210]|eukprot:XP_001015333.1 papain family cysteine protease [Tetrahymena thermophila SB210]
MKRQTIFIVAALLSAALTGFYTYEALKHKEFKYSDRLKQLAEEVNNANTTWKAGENIKWINADIAGVKAHLGALEGDNGENLPVSNAVKADLPTAFDARQQWGDKCTSLWEVRDQSNCGSCWAFGAVESLTDRHCIHLGQDIRLSAQNMLTCCATCGQGCNGGYPASAMSYYVKTGLVTGDLYNTTGWCQAYSFAPCAHHVDTPLYPACTGELPTPKCAKTCDSGSGQTYTVHKGSKAYSVGKTQEAIMTEIQTNGPVEAAFTVYEDFLNYKSGVYKHVTGKALGGHAIKIVGWGVENNTPYWIVVNSWNQTWGDNGTFKILRGKNECGIEAQVVTALPLN